MDIKGSVAVVTGGASGLGEASVRNFVRHGARVAILDFNAERGQEIASELGDSVLFYKTDVADEDSVQAALDQTVAAFGAIHVAINCAGVGVPEKILGKNGPMPIKNFNRVIQINLIGTMNVIRLAAEKMAANSANADGERGVIISTASVAAFEGQVGQAAYTASKAAIVGLTLPVAREFARIGIRAVTIAPGLFETPMMAGLPEKAKASLTQMMPFPKRLGSPDEYAALAGHIVTNAMLNGETIRLDAAIRMGAS